MEAPCFCPWYLFCEFKAPHFYFKFVQSSTQNDITSLELHINAQKSRDPELDLNVQSRAGFAPPELDLSLQGWI
jgi:hypothetical protein